VYAWLTSVADGQTDILVANAALIYVERQKTNILGIVETRDTYKACTESQ